LCVLGQFFLLYVTLGMKKVGRADYGVGGCDVDSSVSS